MTNPQDMMLADGLSDALIGYAVVDGNYRAVYSVDRIIEILCQRDGMEYFDAYEFYEFNIEGAYMGVNTPVFVRTGPIEEAFVGADDD